MAAEHEGMDLRLLGPVRAWRDGQELMLGSARRTAVFSVLALHANHAVSREQLANAVWGDNPPASATGNVYTYVSSLRQVLEPARDRWAAGQMLTSGGGSYCLHVPWQAVDVFRFEALREEGRRHRADGDRPAELAALTEAIDLWRGEALAGVPGPYAEAQRLRLTELRIATVERHAGLLVELGRHDEAVTELRKLVEAYPLRENPHGLLMEALHATGRRSEALSVHDRLRALLLEEMGTEPSAALRAIHSRIVAGGASSSGPAPAGPAVFVGRAAEVRRLRAAAADVAVGRGGSVWLKATSGMGKSALLAAALRDAAPPGCRLGWAVGDELAGRLPLGVLLECVESAMSDNGTCHLVEELSAIADDALSSPRAGTVDRAVGVIRQAARTAPLILVVDGLERADDLSLEVWTALHRLTAQVPLLLVGAGHPAPDDPRLDELRSLPVEVLELTGLAPADAAVLVRMVAADPPEPRAMRGLLADAGGSPYYLRQLASAPWPHDEAAGGPPAQIVAAVAAHLDPLTEETRQMLRAVAFLDADYIGSDGKRSTLPELAVVTGRPLPELRRALAPARAAGLLEEIETGLVFRHPIVARVLLEGTPTALRVMLHRSFAEKIAAAHGAPERVVAQLLAVPIPLDGWSSRWLTRHVEELGTRAPMAAIAMLQRARVQHNLDHDVQVGLTAWLARLLFRTGRNALAEAGWVAARATDEMLEAEMRWIVAATHEGRGDYNAAAEVIRSVLSSRRAPQPWQQEFLSLLERLRPKLPGDPTEPHMRRPRKIGDPISVIR
jgi:DNA-binding SARP family transcriptional activator